MAKDATTKRTMLTPAERVVKLERELAEAKAKAEQRTSKQAQALIQRRNSLVAQIRERQDKVDAIVHELVALGMSYDDAEVPPVLEVVADEVAAS